ncbi:YPO3983 family protein [Mixta calida]|uniref:YPO3983 family protein n=1 Tax=Mixta calida TaxID=665913 RepID=UPI00403A7D38
MNDCSASDTRCGDLSEYKLKKDFKLVDVSTRVNPYTLMEMTPFSQPQSMFNGSHRPGRKLTVEACADILFDEFRHLAQAFAFFGPYRQLIKELIAHMQGNSGFPFESLTLNSALKQHIVNDLSENSTLIKIKHVLQKNIDWNDRCYPKAMENEIRLNILNGRLPRFDRLQDSFNGMGISVHDTWATHITIKHLKIDNDCFHARVYYGIQDHFGLDCNDVTHFTFSQFRLFRIWFVLQRYTQFGFKPFMTDMSAFVDISGVRNDSKK